MIRKKANSNDSLKLRKLQSLVSLFLSSRIVKLIKMFLQRIRAAVMSHTCRHVERIAGGRLMSSDANETSKMEKTLNQVTLLGRAGGDPQKRGSDKHPVVVFSLATHTNYKYESGDYMQRTDWHRVCIFKPFLRDTVYNYLKKGQRVLVNGRLSYGEIKDEEGVARPTTAIIADEVIFFQSQ